jgi:hypothetical protein
MRLRGKSWGRVGFDVDVDEETVEFVPEVTLGDFGGNGGGDSPSGSKDERSRILP